MDPVGQCRVPGLDQRGDAANWRFVIANSSRWARTCGCRCQRTSPWAMAAYLGSHIANSVSRRIARLFVAVCAASLTDPWDSWAVAMSSKMMTAFSGRAGSAARGLRRRFPAPRRDCRPWNRSRCDIGGSRRTDERTPREANESVICAFSSRAWGPPVRWAVAGPGSTPSRCQAGRAHRANVLQVFRRQAGGPVLLFWARTRCRSSW